MPDCASPYAPAPITRSRDCRSEPRHDAQIDQQQRDRRGDGDDGGEAERDRRADQGRVPAGIGRDSRRAQPWRAATPGGSDSDGLLRQVGDQRSERTVMRDASMARRSIAADIAEIAGV